CLQRREPAWHRRKPTMIPAAHNSKTCSTPPNGSPSPVSSLYRTEVRVRDPSRCYQAGAAWLTRRQPHLSSSSEKEGLPLRTLGNKDVWARSARECQATFVYTYVHGTARMRKAP